MAQLQYPTLLGSQPLHPREVVHHHGPDTTHYFWRYRRQGPLPASKALLAWKEHRVEKGGVVATTGLERHQVQDPELSAELKAQAVGQKDEWPWRDLLRAGTSDKAPKRLPKAISVGRQVHAGTLRKKLAKCEAVQENPAKKEVGRTMGRATALSWSNRPCVSALHTLPPSWAISPDPGIATRGFRVLGVHARELLHSSLLRTRGKQA